MTGNASAPRTRLEAWGVLICATIPWLNPVASGPTPSLQAWLLTAFLAALLFAACPVRRPSLALSAVIAAVLGWTALRSPSLSPQLLWTLVSVGLVICAAMVAAAPRSDTWFDASLAGALVLAASASSLAAMAQYFGIAAALDPFVNLAGPGEAFANLRQRNQFATLTTLGLAALAWHHWPVRWGGWLVPGAILLALGNAASASRTGGAQLALLLVLAAAWGGPPRRERLRILGIACIAYLVAILLLPEVLAAWGGTDGNSALKRLAGGEACSSRQILWSNVLELVGVHPWLGWGWGELDFAHYTHLYAGPRFCDILDNAHNLPLHLAVELGLPMAGLVCAAVAWRIVVNRPWRDTDPLRQFAWAALALLALHSVVEYPLWYGPFQMTLGLCAGLLMRARDSVPARHMSLPRLAFAAACVAGIAFTAWDYDRISQVFRAYEDRKPAYRDDTFRKIAGSWLFAEQVRFAELTTTGLSRGNALEIHSLATQLVHYSPEPRVIEKLVESAVMLGRDDEALYYLARFRAAFPAEHAAWAQANAAPAVLRK